MHAIGQPHDSGTGKKERASCAIDKLGRCSQPSLLLCSNRRCNFYATSQMAIAGEDYVRYFHMAGHSSPSSVLMLSLRCTQVLFIYLMKKRCVFNTTTISSLVTVPECARSHQLTRLATFLEYIVRCRQFSCTKTLDDKSEAILSQLPTYKRPTWITGSNLWIAVSIH